MKYKFIATKKKKKNPLLAYLSIENLLKGPTPDLGLVYSVFGLLVFGWLMVYSSSAMHAEAQYLDQFFFLKKQILWSLIGLCGFVLASNVPSSVWQRFTPWVYLSSVVLLGLVLVIGREISGAKRWLHFPGMSFQPSELAKLAMIFVVADYMDRRQSRLKDFKRGLLPILLIVALLLGLIAAEPDLGTPVLMSGVFLVLLLIGGARWKHFFLMMVAALPFVVLGVMKVRYRWERLLAYLDPWEDAKGKGYQLIQSLTALGSGGIFGRGLGESRLKIKNLPDCHTDFIFSIIGEELGLLGTLTCVGLFLFLCLRGLKISLAQSHFFSRLVGVGISLMIGFQAIINMGVAAGLFPTKGMTLPFISFGGSSLLVTLFSVGILAGLSRHIPSQSSEPSRR